MTPNELKNPISLADSKGGPLSAHSSTTYPVYRRLPKSGTLDDLTGLSRSALNELILPCTANGFKPPVRSVVLKKRHATRGVRLIVVESLLEHLRRLEDEGVEA